jgi:hypothetical protein
METAVITTAVPKASNKAIIITVIATKVSVSKVHPVMSVRRRLHRAEPFKVV